MDDIDFVIRAKLAIVTAEANITDGSHSRVFKDAGISTGLHDNLYPL